MTDVDRKTAEGILFTDQYQLTMAQLPMDEKNKLSHRARAVKGARGKLLSLLDK